VIKPKSLAPMEATAAPGDAVHLLAVLRHLTEQSRQTAVVAVNAGLT
jgi:hypothetical protein